MALSSLETTYGVGLTLGPLLGGFLYETGQLKNADINYHGNTMRDCLGGFYLPFAVCGSCLCLCGLVAFFVLPSTETHNSSGGSNSVTNDVDDSPTNNNNSNDADVEVVSIGYRSLLRKPSIVYCCLTLVISGVSASWYLPSLQVGTSNQ